MPLPATVALIPVSETTDWVADEYVHVPGVDGVGATRSKADAP